MPARDRPEMEGVGFHRGVPIYCHDRAAVLTMGIREFSVAGFLTQSVGRAVMRGRRERLWPGQAPKLPSRKALWPQGLGGV